MKIYLAPKVLIIDEWYLPLDELGAMIFVQQHPRGE
jgi:hypothetical protein